MTRAGLPIIVFAGLVLAAGALHGSFTGRWHTSAELTDAVSRLDKVPLALGDWRGERQILDETDLRSGGIRGHFSGRFKNTHTGETVSLLIVCGRPGPISVHTPDICYGGAGYQAVADAQRVDVPMDRGAAVPMWAMRFKAPSSVGSSQIEIKWAWNSGDGWQAPKNPRLSFASYAALYKLYLVREIPAIANAKNKDASVSFLHTFIPELEKILSRKS